jgi:hypothetical protein
MQAILAGNLVDRFQPFGRFEGNLELDLHTNTIRVAASFLFLHKLLGFMLIHPSLCCHV